jgi:hypothetical protein
LNSLTALFLEKEGNEEVICLDFYNKFKNGVDSELLDLKYINQKLFIDEFIHLEKLDNFEIFVQAYEQKFLCIKKNLKIFDDNFVEVLNFFNDAFIKDFFFLEEDSFLEKKSLIKFYISTVQLYDSLVFLYGYDKFFLNLVDVCNTHKFEDFDIFFFRLGEFIFFLEMFIVNLESFIINENFSFNEFHGFLKNCLIYYRTDFFFLDQFFENLKTFLDFQGYSYFFFFDESFFLKNDKIYSAPVLNFDFNFFTFFFDYFFSFFFLDNVFGF